MNAASHLRGPALEAGHAPAAREPYVLKGHSGARVLLLPKGDAYVVRKTAGSSAQNARLASQGEKQRQLLYSGIPLPAVLETGTDGDGLAYFEMEYVPGRTVGNIVCEAMPFDTAPVIAAIRRLFDFLRLTAGAPLGKEAFLDKLAQIKTCKTPAAMPFTGAIAAAAGRLSRLSWEGMPQSASHGDLTLENVMVSEARGVVFIDCDECFVSSWWLDAAKLFQDIDGHWCLRDLYFSAERGAALLNASELLDDLGRTLRRTIAEFDNELAARLPQLAALHLLRTIPYATDPAVVAFVLARVANVLSRLEET